VGYVASQARHKKMKAITARIEATLRQLNMIHRKRIPGTMACIRLQDCALDNHSFWDDQTTKDHVQYQAFKCVKKLERANEEAVYTSSEIESVLKWCDAEISETAACLQTFDQTLYPTISEELQRSVIGRKLAVARARQVLWCEQLEPERNLA